MIRLVKKSDLNVLALIYKELYDNADIGEKIRLIDSEEEFPQCWYNRIDFKKDNELIIMNGNVDDVLENLK